MRKNTYIAVSISVLLVTGLYINFILQKDFLTELGFEGFLAIICILFFDASKIISEIMFFKLKSFTPRLIIGVFALFLILLSVYTTFSVRTWKSMLSYQTTENVNIAAKNKNSQAKSAKRLLNKHLNSLDDQIKTKRGMIKALKNRDKNKWLALQYSKGISKLNDQKLTILKKLESTNQQEIIITNPKLSLKHALEVSLGTGSETLEIATNLTIALVTDGIILFLCFALSFILALQDELQLKELGRNLDMSLVQKKDSKAFSFKRANKPNTQESFLIEDTESILFYDDTENKQINRQFLRK